MDIYVINLKRSLERRKLMEEQFKKIGLNVIFFEAVDGRNLSQVWLNKRHSQFYSQIRGFLGFARDEEIACFASHYLLWKKCVELGKPIVILEDDIIINDNFQGNIKFINNILNKTHYLRLMAKESGSPHLKVSNCLNLYIKYPCGTQGYMIDSYAAKQFLKYANKWSEPVDCYMDRWYLHGLRAYCFNPELISHRDNYSEIGERSSTKLTGVTKILRAFIRIFPIVTILRKLIVGYMNPIVKASDVK